MKVNDIKIVFNGRDVQPWKYCPVCGNEILEVYPGDSFGHIMCFKDDDSCEIDFEVWEEGDDGKLWR